MKKELNRINELMIFIFHILMKRKGILNGATKNYQLINLFKDTDLMLKLFLYLFYMEISENDKNKNLFFFKDLRSSLSLDLGYLFYFSYNKINSYEEEKYIINKMDGLKMSETNEFRRIIVIGDAEIQTIVKNLENKIKIDSIIYLSFNDDIRNKIKEYKTSTDDGYWSHGIIIIINLNDTTKYYSELNIIAAELAVYIDIFVYIKNQDI